MSETVRPRAEKTVGKDLLASLVVFLVALPLCLGIALAAGVPPALGLITGIVGGIVVGFFSGSPLQVSGPAAGLVAIVWEVVHQHGLEGLGVIVLAAGVLQLLAGFFKLGTYFRAVSPAVIMGMLGGIGVLIFASQFHVMVDDIPGGNGLQNLLSIPGAVIKGVFPLDGTTHHLAAIIGVMTLIVLIGWKILPKKIKQIPASLVAVILAMVVADGFGLPIKFVSVPDNMLAMATFPTTDSWSLLSQGSVWVSVVTFAFVASAETMLSANAVDQMAAKSGIRTNYNKEILAQGIGNSICGLLGALPMTGVIVRSSANVDAGAKTRLSTMLHGVWLLALIVFFPHILELIPTASLAAILVYTGYKLFNPPAIAKLWREAGRSEVLIYAITLTMVVSTNLLEGVLVGFGLSVLKLLYKFARLSISVSGIEGSERIDVTLRGSATFLSLPRLAEQLESLPGGREVHVHVQGVEYIDHACLELLQKTQAQYGQSGGELTLEWGDVNARNQRNLSSEKPLLF